MPSDGAIIFSDLMELDVLRGCYGSLRFVGAI